jgi:GTP-binding protein EngB required for normal cell division
MTGALELAEGRLSEESVAFGTAVVDKVRQRARHGTDSTLVALLGATGGGKSSLTNAIVGSDVATTGVRRPTTSTTLACWWGDRDPRPLLDWLEVPNRHQVPTEDGGGPGSPGALDGNSPGGSDLDGLVLLDVPDHDSVETTHRLEMERMAEHADLMVWVTDHEKYADEAMHAYLRRLRRHGAVTAVVLNKADQLPPGDLDRCRRDLARLLTEDGLSDVPVIVTSAGPIQAGEGSDGRDVDQTVAPNSTGTTPSGPGGDGRDVGELVELLRVTVAERRAVVARLQADLATSASELLAEVGPGRGRRSRSGAASTTVPDKVTRQLTYDLVAASGLDTVTSAVAAGHRRDAAMTTGWPFTRWVRSLRPHPLRRLHLGPGSGGRSSRPEPSGAQRARVAGAVRDAVGAVTAELPHPWPELVSVAATPDPAVLDDRLDQAIARSVRDERRRPRWWRAVGMVQWVLAAATVTGSGWLGLLALAAYLQLPDIPTPSWGRIPIPTALAIGGIALGLLLAGVARRMAAVGARRRARAIERAAGQAIAGTVDELIVGPMEAELAGRERLRSLLRAAGGREPKEPT